MMDSASLHRRSKTAHCNRVESTIDAARGLSDSGSGVTAPFRASICAPAAGWRCSEVWWGLGSGHGRGTTRMVPPAAIRLGLGRSRHVARLGDTDPVHREPGRRATLRLSTIWSRALLLHGRSACSRAGRGLLVEQRATAVAVGGSGLSAACGAQLSPVERSGNRPGRDQPEADHRSAPASESGDLR